MADKASMPARAWPRLLRRAAAAWLLGCTAVLAGTPGAEPLTVCVSLNAIPPLTYPDRDGQAQLLVRQALERLGGKVAFVTAPWLRCRAGVKTGTYKAIIPMVASSEYLTDYAFPHRNGRVDASRSVGSFTISVLRRTGAEVDWNGNSFTRLTSPVMVLPGQMLARDRLRALGVAEDTDTPMADLLLRKLLMGRRDAAVLPTGAAEQALASEEFRGKLELLPQPLAAEPGYLSFNREFHKAETEFVEQVWNELGRLRRPAGPRN